MRDLYVKCVYSPKNRENSGHLANGTNLISDHLLADRWGATCNKHATTSTNGEGERKTKSEGMLGSSFIYGNNFAVYLST